MAEAVSGVVVYNEKRSAMQLKYLKILRMFLWPSGAWPAHMFGEHMALCFRVLRVGHPFQTFADLIGQMYYIRIHNETITVFDLGHVVVTIFLTVVTVLRQSLPNLKTYGLVIKDFIENFHIIHYKYDDDGRDYYLKIYALTNKISHFFAIYQMTMMVVGMTLFNILPLYNNYKMGAFHQPREKNLTLDFSVFYEFPFLRQEEHFYKITIFNFYLSYNCSTCICCNDLLLSLMVFQVIGRIKLLMYKLEHMPRPKNLNKVSNILQGFCPERNSAKVEMFDEEENKAIHFKLIEVINDHRKIVTFANTMSDFFGPMLALNYLFHLVGGCILLLECSQKDPGALARFLPLTVIIFGQLIQLSIVFEVVGYMSEKLIDSVYHVPWEFMNVSNQQSVRFILSRIQTPLEVTAMGIVPVGVKTMQSILKTTLSFFAFLKSINE